MRSGTASFLVGAALIALLALALVTVALGVLANLKMRHPEYEPAPITAHGRWELRELPDGTHEYAWIARQAGCFGPEIPRPPTEPTAPGRHRIPG